MRKRWRTVPGWPGYKVASRGGHARSVPRRLANGREHGGGLLAQTPDKDGYLTVLLCDAGREQRIPVHVLVLETFDGPRPEPVSGERIEGRHLDGDQLNNDLENLRWGTHRENEQDKRRERKRKEQTNRTGVSSPFGAVTPVTGGLR